MKGKLLALWHELFGDGIRAFGVVSMVLLVLLAIAPAKNHFRPRVIVAIVSIARCDTLWIVCKARSPLRPGWTITCIPPQAR